MARRLAHAAFRIDPPACLRFAANLSMMYAEHAFPDRFAAASADGFEAVEYLFPYAYPAEELAMRLEDNGLVQVLFNAPPGNWDQGERGMACLPGRERIPPLVRSGAHLRTCAALPAFARDGRAARRPAPTAPRCARPTSPTWPGPPTQAERARASTS